MTQINLPNLSVTGANLWSQVEDNDKAIRDVVNGNLDDGNIATGADIDGSKLLAASVGTTELEPGAVTAAKVATQAILSGAIKVATFTGTNSSSWSSSSPATHVIVQKADVTPGLYLAVGELLSSSVTVIGPHIATSGGTATVTQPTFGGGIFRAQSGNTLPAALAIALVQVAATTTVQVTLDKAGPSGLVTGAISLFGIAAS